MRITCNRSYAGRALGLFAAIMTIWWCGFIAPVAHMLDAFGSVLRWLWICGYVWLSFWTANTLTVHLASWIAPPRILPEVGRLPDVLTAIVCPVKNEDLHLLFVRLVRILDGNLIPNMHFWLLSDSDATHAVSEDVFIRKLCHRFPNGVIHYRRRNVPTNMKAGNIRHWLISCGGSAYKYFFVLDQDSYILPGTVAKAIRKAEHPANAGIFIFQCAIQIYNDTSNMARLDRIGAKVAGRIQFPAWWNWTGQFLSWGHNNLVRVSAWLQADPPADAREKSHDIWDAAYGDRRGFRVAYLSDVVTYEETPCDPVSSSQRQRRWMDGSLNATKLILDPNVSLAQRAYILKGAVDFVNMPIFLVWLALGAAIIVRSPGAYGYFWAPVELIPLGLAILTYFVMPLCSCRNRRELLEVLWFLGISYLCVMNSIVNGTISLIRVLAKPAQGWSTMGNVQSVSRHPATVALQGLPSTMLSGFLLAMLVLNGFRGWLPWMLLPMLGGGLFSPYLIYWLAKERKAC